MLTLAVSSLEPEVAVIERAIDVLREGGIVAYPTETFYGLAVDPRSDTAVARLFEAKGRSETVPIPLIAATLEQAEEAAIFSDAERRLAHAFWPGPLTVVARARPALAPRLLAGGETIAVRVPAHAVARAIARELRFCITSTSANRSGSGPAVAAADVVSAVEREIDLLLDGGSTQGGSPSTIVEMGKDGPRLVRAGAVAWKRVLESLG
jgi:L-threonylcarbamoyladenylate synthase